MPTVPTRRGIRSSCRFREGIAGALRFLPVPRGLQTADRPTWLDVLERGFLPAGDHDLLTITGMRRKQVLELAAPDARPLIWTGGDALTSNAFPGAGEGRPDVDEQVVTPGSAPRRIWTHRPQRGPASAPVLVVFDGERFIRGGLLAAIDELVGADSARVFCTVDRCRRSAGMAFEEFVDLGVVDAGHRSGRDRGEQGGVHAGRRQRLILPFLGQVIRGLPAAGRIRASGLRADR